MSRFLHVLLLTFVVGISLAQTDELRTKNFNVKKNIALEGYDPVSYFDSKPVEGDENIETKYRGIIYRFSSQANLNKFRTSPEKYEPAYGGWCAYAMGQSAEKVKIDPETFTILDGRLYLFYNFWGNNTLTDWKKEEHRLKEAADRNWKKIVH